jgi:hypothetical protein
LTDKKYYINEKVEKNKTNVEVILKSLFKNKNFYILRYTDNTKKEMSENIKFTGGIIHDKYNSNLDYIVIKYIEAEEEDQIKKLTNNNIKLISGQYFDDCCRNLKILNINEKPIYKPLSSIYKNIIL